MNATCRRCHRPSAHAAIPPSLCLDCERETAGCRCTEDSWCQVCTAQWERVLALDEADEILRTAREAADA